MTLHIYAYTHPGEQAPGPGYEVRDGARVVVKGPLLWEQAEQALALALNPTTPEAFYAERHKIESKIVELEAQGAGPMNEELQRLRDELAQLTVIPIRLPRRATFRVMGACDIFTGDLIETCPGTVCVVASIREIAEPPNPRRLEFQLDLDPRITAAWVSDGSLSTKRIVITRYPFEGILVAPIGDRNG